MQPIIRRTLTITIVETWTITWPDGRETVWAETHEITQPAIGKSDAPLPTDKDNNEGGVLEHNAADPTADNA